MAKKLYAFQALLAAYLSHALSDISERNKVLGWTTLYTLCPVYDKDEDSAAQSDADLRCRVSNFTGPRAAAVVIRTLAC